MCLYEYINDDGLPVTIAIDTLSFYKSGKLKDKIFFRNLYTVVGIRFGQATIIKENLRFFELSKWLSFKNTRLV